MYSSFVQYRPLEVQKITQPLLYFHCFFNIKFIIFFSKTYFTKSVRNFKIALLYIMKHVKILLYKVTTLNFMYDIYIYRGKKGERKPSIQFYVQLILPTLPFHPIRPFLYTPSLLYISPFPLTCPSPHTSPISVIQPSIQLIYTVPNTYIVAI
jgi:hypothetical protein